MPRGDEAFPTGTDRSDAAASYPAAGLGGPYLKLLAAWRIGSKVANSFRGTAPHVVFKCPSMRLWPSVCEYAIRALAASTLRQLAGHTRNPFARNIGIDS